jgi:hypothetical protein
MSWRGCVTAVAEMLGIALALTAVDGEGQMLVRTS